MRYSFQFKISCWLLNTLEKLMKMRMKKVFLGYPSHSIHKNIHTNIHRTFNKFIGQLHCFWNNSDLYTELVLNWNFQTALNRRRKNFDCGFPEIFFSFFFQEQKSTKFFILNVLPYNFLERKTVTFWTKNKQEAPNRFSFWFKYYRR